MRAAVMTALIDTSGEGDTDNVEGQVWTPTWASRIYATVDTVGCVTNDVENEHSQERHMLADPGVTFDDLSAKFFNTACRRAS